MEGWNSWKRNPGCKDGTGDRQCCVVRITLDGRRNLRCTDKNENQIFLIYEEIQNGAVAKLTNGLLIYGEIFAHFLIY